MYICLREHDNDLGEYWGYDGGKEVLDWMGVDPRGDHGFRYRDFYGSKDGTARQAEVLGVYW